MHYERRRGIRLRFLPRCGRDRLIPPGDAQHFQRDIAGSRLIVFDRLGHVPQEEDPAATVAAVKQFLS